MDYSLAIQKILPLVQRPARYIGNEVNSIHKPFDSVKTRIALAFPDVYDIAMAHPGFQILYHVVNSHEDALAARVFAPWPDMEDLMRKNHIPLFSLEDQRPINEYDLIGFTLQYELSYTGVLNMLALANIPLRSQQRTTADPFVMVGGPCAYNPEPLAPFIDFAVLGEGEEVLDEIIAAHKQWVSDKQATREDFLALIATIEGVYVPSFYEVTYNEDNTIKEIKPTHPAAPKYIQKRLIKELDKAPYPLAPIIPYIEVPHDRMVLELFRGCLRGCRFCQAGFIYRPVREKSVGVLKEQVQQMLKNTGYDEVSLMSLSSSDYSCIHELLRDLNEVLVPEDVSISLPSLRIDNFEIELAEEVQKVRKSGLTLAPEAGTQRLRDVINKQVTEEDLISAVNDAAEAGWKRVKLYFMIGLPTEEDIDLDGIVQMSVRVAKLGKRGPLNITVSAAGFVPKPHTPFQWAAQNSVNEFKRKQQHILQQIKRFRYIKFNYHDSITSLLEAVLARGDRRVADAIEKAMLAGARLDSWDDHFNWDIWQLAFQETGIEPAFYANRKRNYEEVLPWDHLSSGVEKDFLWNEYQLAINSEITADCRQLGCTTCGVCQNLDVDVKLAKGE